MREIILFSFLFITSGIFAQSCEPDPLYADSTFGVYPAPYDEETMTGGIELEACIDEYYEFVLTAIVPESVPVSGHDIPINYIEIDMNADSGGVTGLPVGLEYVCNPPDCRFPANSEGCVLVYGTPTDGSQIGENSLALKLIASTVFADLPIDYPGDFFPGSYAITLNGTGGCEVSTSSILLENVSMKNSPNPFSTSTNIEISSTIKQVVEFQVYDLLGNKIDSESVQLSKGENTIEYNGSHLANGMYIYNLTNGEKVLSSRMIVNK